MHSISSSLLLIVLHFNCQMDIMIMVKIFCFNALQSL